jgi:hypothetical protein
MAIEGKTLPARAKTLTIGLPLANFTRTSSQMAKKYSIDLK